ncbi:MAG: peptidase C69 [Clostridiaceae bacterium BRH_c20a]|nr:MAG: peptidase C69 [Clostridiaceae bacterium BRH_c20a]
MALNDFLKLGVKAVEKALKIGSDNAEVFLLNARDFNIQVANQKIDTIKLAEERGLGIRVFKDRRMGFSYTSDLNDTAVDQVVEQALANSLNTAHDEYLTLAEKTESYPALDLFDQEISQKSVEEKIELAKEIENYAKKYDSRIKITERAAYEDSQYEIWIMNSLGLNGYYQGAYCGGYALVVGEEQGENQTGFGMQYSLKYKSLNPEIIGTDAGKRAVRLLGAASISSQKAPIILEPYIATNFLGIISPALSAEAVDKGKSFLKGKTNKRVASELVTLIDDGQMEGRVLSAPFDGEGIPTSKTVLVEQGVLKGYMHNTYTAKKAGLKSTGNGVRGSYRSTPEVGSTNFYLAPGEIDPEQIIKEIDTGLYVTDVMGMHTANPISGDFSLGASGIWIENGELTKPVRGIAIAGNLQELLGNIAGVCNDLTFFVGKGAPTIKINNISISGS